MLDARHLRRLAAAAALGLAVLTAPAFAQHGEDNVPAAATQNPNGQNPTAEGDQLFQRMQRDKLEGRVSIPDAKSAVLQQPQGRYQYRAYHERWLPWIGGIAILGMFLALAVFYFTKGRIALEPDEDDISGRKIQRFNFLERFNHWMTATSFIVLALTGVNYIFGKRLLFPLIGPDAFATWSQWAKYTHNYVSWPFMLGVLMMLVLWVKDNIPDRLDVQWVKAFGGFFSNRHVDTRRFNAGQKGVFWAVILGGLALSVTGILMLFPFSALDINGMQFTQYVHATIGVLLIAMMLAHIYIGSLGMEGAYDAMGSGEVDLKWAQRHHNLWVEEEQAKTASGTQPVPHAQPAE
jgi:formate dehydrogenase subunit gamma